MENHRYSWVNPLFLWPFSIAFCMFTRGYDLESLVPDVSQLPALNWRWSGRNFSSGMWHMVVPFYGSQTAFSKQAWCSTAPRIRGNSSLRFPTRLARSSHCFWAEKVLCFLLPGLDNPWYLFFACLCQWWKSCYVCILCCFKNIKAICGKLGHIVFT